MWCIFGHDWYLYWDKLERHRRCCSCLRDEIVHLTETELLARQCEIDSIEAWGKAWKLMYKNKE